MLSGNGRFEDRGNIKRAILAIGKQDADIESMTHGSGHRYSGRKFRSYHGCDPFEYKVETLFLYAGLWRLLKTATSGAWIGSMLTAPPYLFD